MFPQLFFGVPSADVSLVSNPSPNLFFDNREETLTCVRSAFIHRSRRSPSPRPTTRLGPPKKPYNSSTSVENEHCQYLVSFQRFNRSLVSPKWPRWTTNSLGRSCIITAPPVRTRTIHPPPPPDPRLRRRLIRLKAPPTLGPRGSFKTGRWEQSTFFSVFGSKLNQSTLRLVCHSSAPIKQTHFSGLYKNK